MLKNILVVIFSVALLSLTSACAGTCNKCKSKYSEQAEKAPCKCEKCATDKCKCGTSCKCDSCKCSDKQKCEKCSKCAEKKSEEKCEKCKGKKDSKSAESSDANKDDAGTKPATK